MGQSTASLAAAVSNLLARLDDDVSRAQRALGIVSDPGRALTLLLDAELTLRRVEDVVYGAADRGVLQPPDVIARIDAQHNRIMTLAARLKDDIAVLQSRVPAVASLQRTQLN